jgi:hypothetical protein
MKMTRTEAKLEAVKTACITIVDVLQTAGLAPATRTSLEAELKDLCIEVSFLEAKRVFEARRSKAARTRRVLRSAMADAMGSIGLVRVRGAMGGIYWE